MGYGNCGKENFKSKTNFGEPILFWLMRKTYGSTQKCALGKFRIKRPYAICSIKMVLTKMELITFKYDNYVLLT